MGPDISLGQRLSQNKHYINIFQSIKSILTNIVVKQTSSTTVHFFVCPVSFEIHKYLFVFVVCNYNYFDRCPTVATKINSQEFRVGSFFNFKI